MRDYKQFTIELRKYKNKDYTMHIYENLNYFAPVLSIKKPIHWNKCVQALSQFLRAKQMINVFQKKRLEDELLTGEDKL